MERNEEEIIRAFSMVFLDIGRFTCIGKDHLENVRTSIRRYEELKIKYGEGINTEDYDNRINFTLDTLEGLDKIAYIK